MAKAFSRICFFMIYGLEAHRAPCYSPGRTFCRPERKVNDQSRRHRASAPAASFRRISRGARPQGRLSNRKPEPGTARGVARLSDGRIAAGLCETRFLDQIDRISDGKESVSARGIS